MADEKKIATQTCKTCQQELAITNFTSQLLRNTYATSITEYWRHECKKCYAAKSYTKVGGLANKLTAEEKAFMLEFKNNFATDSIKTFHSRCGLSMKLDAFRRYCKIGEVTKFLGL